MLTTSTTHPIHLLEKVNSRRLVVPGGLRSIWGRDRHRGLLESCALSEGRMGARVALLTFACFQLDLSAHGARY